MLLTSKNTNLERNVIHSIQIHIILWCILSLFYTGRWEYNLRVCVRLLQCTHTAACNDTNYCTTWLYHSWNRTAEHILKWFCLRHKSPRGWSLHNQRVDKSYDQTRDHCLNFTLLEVGTTQILLSSSKYWLKKPSAFPACSNEWVPTELNRLTVTFTVQSSNNTTAVVEHCTYRHRNT